MTVSIGAPLVTTDANHNNDTEFDSPKGSVFVFDNNTEASSKGIVARIKQMFVCSSCKNQPRHLELCYLSRKRLDISKLIKNMTNKRIRFQDAKHPNYNNTVWRIDDVVMKKWGKKYSIYYYVTDLTGLVV
jgi:hypothetical protein